MALGNIPLNSGLVTIIGPRGSGKTALAEIVARAGHAADSGTGDASFLKRASSPTDYLGSAEVRVTWEDGTSTQTQMSAAHASDVPEDVRYLSQHFVDRLCSSSGLATELRAAMEEVVFASIDPTERMEADTFDDLATRLLEPIQSTYADLQVQIDTIGDAVVHEDILHDKLATLKVQRAALAKKIESTKKEQKKLIPKGNEERATLLARLEQACIAAGIVKLSW